MANGDRRRKELLLPSDYTSRGVQPLEQEKDRTLLIPPDTLTEMLYDDVEEQNTIVAKASFDADKSLSFFTPYDVSGHIARQQPIKSFMGSDFSAHFPEKDKRITQIEAIEDIGDRDPFWNAMLHGLGEGVQQNIHLVTGLKPQETSYTMSLEAAEKLKSDGLITQDQFDRFVKNRNQLPFLTSAVAAITNSLMIAGQIAITAPYQAIRLTAGGIKWYSKAAMGRLGYEVLKQGKNSFKVMGGGATIRTAVEADEEIQERMKNDPDFHPSDVTGIVYKHAFLNYSEAFMEGASEGLLRQVRMADVNIRDLKKLSPAAWKTLGNNLWKKQILGTATETATEQVTDLWQDIFSGNNIFTEGVNAINIIFGKDANIRKGALENLAIEAIVGFFLGNIMGAADIVRAPIEQTIQDSINKGEMTKQQGEIALDTIVNNPGVIKEALIKKLEALQPRSDAANQAQDKRNTGRMIYEFGTQDNPGVRNVDKQASEAALAHTRAGIPTILAETELTFREEAFKRNSPFVPNVLDYVMETGRRSASIYLEELEKQPGKRDIHEVGGQKISRAETTKISLITDPMLDMGTTTQHVITERAINGMVVEGAFNKIPDELNLQKTGLSPEQTAKLEKDLVIGIVGGFGEIGWDIVEAKWTGAGVDAAVMAELIKQSQELQSPELTSKGKKLIDDAINYALDLSKVKQNIESITDEHIDVQSNPSRADGTDTYTLDDSSDFGALSQMGFRGKGDSIETKAKKIAEQLGVIYDEGVFNFKQGTFVNFTDPLTNSSRAINANDLTLQNVAQLMIDIRIGYKAPFKEFVPKRYNDNLVAKAQRMALAEMREQISEGRQKPMETRFKDETSTIAYSHALDSYGFMDRALAVYEQLNQEFPLQDPNSLGAGLRLEQVWRHFVKTLRQTGIDIIPIEPLNQRPQQIERGSIPKQITFEARGKYGTRTIVNVQEADITLAFAVNYDTWGEIATANAAKKAKKPYVKAPIKAGLKVSDERVNSLVEELNKVNARRINIAGNGLDTLQGAFTQAEIDAYMLDLLKAVVQHPGLINPIESIRSGGQTGVDEAGTKAAAKLGIKSIVLAPEGWLFRDIKGIDIRSEEQFKYRFKELGAGNLFNLGDVQGEYIVFLKDWKGGTHKEFVQFLIDNQLIEKAFEDLYLKLVTKHIGDVNVIVAELQPVNGKEIPGQFIPRGMGTGIVLNSNQHTIVINPRALYYNNVDLFRTALHEAFHAFTYDFLRSNTPEGQKFLTELTAIANEAKLVLYNSKAALEEGRWLGTEEQYYMFVTDHMEELKVYLEATQFHDELIAGVLSSTTALRNFLQNISSISKMPQKSPETLYDRIWAAIKEMWSLALPAKPNLLSNLIDVMSQASPKIETFHKRKQHAPGLKALMQRSIELEKNYPHLPLKDIIEEDPNLDPDQQDDITEESVLTEAEFNGVMDIISTIKKQTPKDMRKIIAKLDWEGFSDLVAGINAGKNGIINAKLKTLYENEYKNKISGYENFVRRYLKGFYNKIANTKTMPHVMMVSMLEWDKQAEKSVPRLSMEVLGETFKIKDTGVGNSYAKTIVLESFLAPLAKRLQEMVPGLRAEDVTLTYVAGFESRKKNGELRSHTNLKYLKADFFKVKKDDLDVVDPFATTQYFAEALNHLTTVEDGSRFMVYIGNFGGNNTVPLLTFPASQKDAVITALTKYGEAYKEVAKAELRFNLHNIGARLLLEDLWFGAQINNPQDVANNTIAGKMDINALWKRGKKFIVTQNKVVDSASSLKEVFGDKQFIGTTVQDGSIHINTAVYSSNDNGTITVTSTQGETITVPMQALLRNYAKAQTPRHDGVSFYIFDELDILYHEIHGTVKDGVLKNVYSSYYGDPKPMYIKHAMHGVHRDSVLGRFMRKHNLALLVSDTALKLPREFDPVQLSSHMSPAAEQMTEATGQVFKLKLNNFQRIKEELGTNPYAGPTKQMLNGSGFLAIMNDALAQADTQNRFDQYWKTFSANLGQRTNTLLKELTTKESLVRSLYNIALSPESTDEQLVADMLKSLGIQDLTEEEVFRYYENIVNVPHIAEFIRRRLFRTVSDALNGKVGGMRLTFVPNPGYMNEQASVTPVTNKYNLNDMLLNLPITDKALMAALPEPELRQIAKEYQMLQRQESKMHSKRSFTARINGQRQDEYLKARKQELKDLIVALASRVKNPARQRALKRGDLYSAIVNAPEVKEWKQNIIDEILDPQTGTLRGNWVIATEDYAAARGLKAGDRAILEVTPADSPTGFVAVRIAGISPVFSNDKNKHRKVSDRMSIQANSELLQTIIGKDFDIDTVAMLDNDPEFWAAGHFDYIWETMDRARDLFIKKVTQTTKQVLGEYVILNDGTEIKIDEESAFSQPVREKYAQELMGSTGNAKSSFNPVQDFFFIDNAYLVDPALIFNERLYHTALSAIGFEYKSMWEGEVNWKARGPRWFVKHLFDLIDTNFRVDFPGQTSKLTYNSDLNDPDIQVRMHALRFNVDPNDIMGWVNRNEENRTQAHFKTAVVNDVMQFLFRKAFDLAKGNDREVSQKYNHYSARQALRLQKDILNKLANGQMLELLDMYVEEKQRYLNSIYQDSGNSKYYRDQAEKLQNRISEARNVFTTMKVDDVYAYPMFEMIRNLDTQNMPMPGMSFADWMINQSAAMENLVKSSGALWKTLQEDVFGQKDTKLREFFTKPPTAANVLAKEIVKEYLTHGYLEALKRGQVPISVRAHLQDRKSPLTWNEKLDLIVSDPQLFGRILGYTNEKRVKMAKQLVDEWSDLLAMTGQPYPADFVKGGVEYHITDKAIGQQLIPFYLDVARNRRHTEAFERRLSAARDEMVQIVQLYDEVEPKMGSAFIERKRWARSVAYPKIFKQILGQERINLTGKVPNAQLSYDGKTVTVSAVKGGKLVFILDGIRIEHTDLREMAPGLYKSLTQQEGLWQGTTAKSPGVRNRWNIQQVIDIQGSLNLEARLEMAKEHIMERIYNPKAEWNLSDIQGFWVSFGGQVTNDALRDGMHDSLAPSKMYRKEDQPTYFWSNQIYHSMLAQFEPSMFETLMQELDYVTKTNLPYDAEIGYRISQTSQNHADILNQTRFDETSPRERQRTQWELFAEEMDDLAKGTEWKDFTKALKVEGSIGALNILRKLIKSTETLHALAASEIFYGEMMKDIKTLSPEKLAKKYEDNPYNYIQSRMNGYLQGAEALGEVFFAERLKGKHNVDGTLAALWFELKAAERIGKRPDEVINKWTKWPYGKTSYTFIAPIKEKKVFLSNTETAKIDIIYTQNGVDDLTFGQLTVVNRNYATREHRGVGLSSVAMIKSQAIATQMNRAQVDLSNAVSNLDELVVYMTDAAARTQLLTMDETTLTSELKYIKRFIAKMEDTGADKRTRDKIKSVLLGEDLKPNVYIDMNGMAENMIKKTGIRIISSNGVLQYIIPIKSKNPNNPYHDQRRFFSKEALIETIYPNLNAYDKMVLYGGLEIRELYDIKVPDLMNKVEAYIRETENSLMHDRDSETLLYLQQLRRKYQQYHDAILSKFGGYIPHVYPVGTYKILWKQHESNIVSNQLLVRIDTHQKLKRQGKHHDPYWANMDRSTPEGQKIFEAELERRLDAAWAKLEINEGLATIIPNFLPRHFNPGTGYQDGNSEIHYKYITKLVNAMKQDMLMADALLYKHKARTIGERSALIQLTTMWYADQISNRMMHTKKVKLSKAKPGMHVHFLTDAFTVDTTDNLAMPGDVSVWGIIEKVDEETGIVRLKVDKLKMRYGIESNLNKAQRQRDTRLIHEEPTPASKGQMLAVQNLMEQGYIKLSDFILEGEQLRDVTETDALNAIIKGYEEMLRNEDKWGVYNIDKIFTKDLRGNRLTGDQLELDRYMRRGITEYLDAKAREANNIRGVMGNFNSMTDSINYYKWKTLAWPAHRAAELKTVFGMAVMGMVSAPRAFFTNYFGAGWMNMNDAPYQNWKRAGRGKLIWKAIKKKKPGELTIEEKKWADMFAAFGLKNTSDLVAISLQSGNLDPVELLSGQGFLANVKYLYKGMVTSSGVEAYVERQQELRRRYYSTPLEQYSTRRRIAVDMITEKYIFEMFMDGKIKSYKELLLPETLEDKEMSGKATIDELIKLRDLRAQRSTVAAQMQALKAQGYKPKTSFAFAHSLTRKSTTVLAAKLAKNHLVTGWFGLGLQAKAESLRRPGFWIGYYTALEMGYTEEEAIQFGLASVEYRHAYYGAPHKQFDANTILGSFGHQYAQYGWNSFTKMFANIRQAVPQILSKWYYGKQQGKNWFSRILDIGFKDSTILDDQGKPIKSKELFNEGVTWKDVNVVRRMMFQASMTLAGIQIGNRLIWGTQNWMPPVWQAVYGLIDMALKGLMGDIPEEEKEDIAFFVNEQLFFLGVPYKLASQGYLADDEDGLLSTYYRGRIEDQIDFWYVMYNTGQIVFGDETSRSMRRQGKRFATIPYLLDDFVFGIKLFGYSNPDPRKGSYEKQGWRPVWDWPPIQDVKRKVEVKKRPTSIDTGGEGISDFVERLGKHGIAEWRHNLIPFFDRFTEQWEKTKGKGR